MVRQAHHPESSRRVNLKFQYPMAKDLGFRCQVKKGVSGVRFRVSAIMSVISEALTLK